MNAFSVFLLICCLIFSVAIGSFAAWIRKLKMEIDKLNRKNDIQTGHKHLFFMLKNCISEERPSGMFNEYLVQELYDHRRVMEALGGQMRVESTEDQLDEGYDFAKKPKEYDGSDEHCRTCKHRFATPEDDEICENCYGRENYEPDESINKKEE